MLFNNVIDRGFDHLVGEITALPDLLGNRLEFAPSGVGCGRGRVVGGGLKHKKLRVEKGGPTWFSERRGGAEIPKLEAVALLNGD